MAAAIRAFVSVKVWNKENKCWMNKFEYLFQDGWEEDEGRGRGGVDRETRPLSELVNNVHFAAHVISSPRLCAMT